MKLPPLLSLTLLQSDETQEKFAARVIIERALVQLSCQHFRIKPTSFQDQDKDGLGET
jgi:hypothetical protein